MYALYVTNMNKLNDKALKGIVLIAVIIIVMAALIRMMNSAETLSDYAAKHPEQQISTDISPAVK